MKNKNEILRKVLSYKNQNLTNLFIERLNLTKAEADRLLSDTLKFLFLCATTGKPLAPPKKIDEGWHYFILCTEDYEIFCREHFGMFIHHRPAIDGKVEGIDSDLETLHFLTLAEVVKLNNSLRVKTLSKNFESGINPRDWCCHATQEEKKMLVNFESGINQREWCTPKCGTKPISLS